MTYLLSIRNDSKYVISIKGAGLRQATGIESAAALTLMLSNGMYCRLSLATLDRTLGWIFSGCDAMVGARVLTQRFRMRKKCLCRVLTIMASASIMRWEVRGYHTGEPSSDSASHAVPARGSAAGACGQTVIHG